jgi:hypothetical protein
MEKPPRDSNNDLVYVGIVIVAAGVVTFLASIDAFNLFGCKGRDCHSVDPGLAQAIAGAVAALLTVLALVAASRAIAVSEQHFDIEQRPLVTPFRADDAASDERRIVPMQPRPVRVAPAGAYIERLDDQVAERVAFSLPYRNIGRGVARIDGLRIHPRNVHEHDGRVHEIAREGIFVAAESDGRVWFNVELNLDTAWIADVLRKGQLPIEDQGLQARFDIDFVYTDIRGRNPQVTRFLVRPRYGSAFEQASDSDAASWYAEGARHFDGRVNPQVQDPPKPKARADRATAQSAAGGST